MPSLPCIDDLMVTEETVKRKSLIDITLESNTSGMETGFINDSDMSTESSHTEDELETLWATCARKLQFVLSVSELARSVEN